MSETRLYSPRVVIIGAGVGGLSFAIALKRKFGYQNFTVSVNQTFPWSLIEAVKKIFEKTNAVGGTWHENTYPGCSSDVPIHFYSLSTDQKPDWTSSHPFQPEIREYWDELTQKYSLTPHIKFGTIIVKAVWDSNASCYHVTSEDVKTGTQSTIHAEILVSALGILERPRFPDIPGLSNFKGTLFHSARWVDMKLDGKRIAVIGNGASATQFLPIIAKTPNIHITQFCRTPNWLLPPVRLYYSDFHRFACQYVPLYMRTVRFLNYLVLDFAYFAVFANRVTRRPIQKLVERYINNSSPEEYRKYLVPKYDLGCRRVLFDSDYLSILHQSNVHLNYGGIGSIVKDGIITQEGEHLPFDVIIFATGYRVDQYPLHIEGKSGKTVQDYYDSKGGPTAYMGTTVPGFPNLYMLGGPNTVTGHTSVIFTEEVQINYSLELIKPILDGKLSAVDARPEATDRYNEILQKRLSRSVFVGCNSWYRMNGTGKITNMFPGSSATFWWWLRCPNWADYEVTVRDEGKKKPDFVRTFCFALIMAVAAWYLTYDQTYYLTQVQKNVPSGSHK